MHCYPDFYLPEGLVSGFPLTGLDGNDVYRINKITALDVRNSPDISLAFGLQGQDADRDRTSMTPFTVMLDNGIAGL
jgi:hypothetical protein